MGGTRTGYGKSTKFCFLKACNLDAYTHSPSLLSPHPYSSLLLLKSQMGQNKISTSSAADQSVPGEISRFCPAQVPFSDGRTLCSANLPEQHNSSSPCICTPSSCFPGEHQGVTDLLSVQNSSWREPPRWYHRIEKFPHPSSLQRREARTYLDVHTFILTKISSLRS